MLYAKGTGTKTKCPFPLKEQQITKKECLLYQEVIPEKKGFILKHFRAAFKESRRYFSRNAPFIISNILPVLWRP